MARSIWTGFLSFGLVNVPVGLYPATRDQTLHFNQLRKGTSNRIRYKKVDEETGEEVSNDEIVSGYDVGGGEYVVVDKDELKAAAPGRSELIEISDFVDLEDIDPMYFRQTYYLAPRGKGSDRAYALLRQAMGDTSKVGIATFVLRDKEHLVAVRPGDEALILETMFFSDEIRDARSELEDDLPADVEFKGRELDIARQLIESLSTEWTPEKYKNTYRERVEAIIDEKRQGREIVVHHERPKSNVIDLMSALEASVERAREGEPAASAETKPTRAKAAATNEAQQQFDGMTKAELLERATELEVEGRSKMSKPELVDALTEAAAGRRKRRAS